MTSAEPTATDAPRNATEDEPDYRFTLANERTYLAWLRTSLSLLAAGVALVQLVPTFPIPGVRSVFGGLLVALAVLTAAGGLLRWLRVEHAMRCERDLPRQRIHAPRTPRTCAPARVTGELGSHDSNGHGRDYDRGQTPTTRPGGLAHSRCISTTGRVVGPVREGLDVAVILDTGDYPPGERAELVHDVISGRGVPTVVEIGTGLDQIQLRMESWLLGSVFVMRTTGTALRLWRTDRHLRGGAPELFALTLALSDCVHTACGVTQRHHRHDAHLNDLTGPTDIAHRGPRGGSLIVHMSCEETGISVDTVRSALPRLRSSPLLPVVRHHLVQVQGHLDIVSADAAVAGSVGSATVELTRGLVFSAAGDRREREVLHETLKTRIRTYVLRHLKNPDLTVDRIAAAHHVSRRTLYKIWGDEDPPLMEWIMRERLAKARGDLSDPDQTSTIALIARRWGFSDAGHFARRFRAQYGMSPSTWRSGER